MEKTAEKVKGIVLSRFGVFNNSIVKAGQTDCQFLSSYSKSRISSSLCPICGTLQFDRLELLRDRSSLMAQRTLHLSTSESAMVHLLFSLRHQGKGPCSSFWMSLRFMNNRQLQRSFSFISRFHGGDCVFVVTDAIACSGVIKLGQSLGDGNPSVSSHKMHVE